jgi:hypothetical protein
MYSKLQIAQSTASLFLVISEASGFPAAYFALNVFTGKLR